MTDYQKYINALRKCAKEHENDTTYTGHIIISDLCRDTANLLEALEQEPCEDAISRKAVLNQIFYSTDNSGDVVLGSVLRRRIEKLPSVKPQESKWIPIKTRPLTDKEKEKYAYLGYSDEELGFMYDCLMPNDGEEVLITTRYDEVKTDTFYRDEGGYFESYCDEDDVKAWMPLPKPYEPQERNGKE